MGVFRHAFNHLTGFRMLAFNGRDVNRAWQKLHNGIEQRLDALIL